MIIQVILISIIIIIWLQYPQIKDTNENKYLKIFNTIKIPITVICLLIIIYLYSNTNNIPTVDKLDVYMSVPNFK